MVGPTAQVPDALGHTSYRHIETEHSSPSFLWAIRYAWIIYHTKPLSLSFPVQVPRSSYIGNTNHGIRGTFVR